MKLLIFLTIIGLSFQIRVIAQNNNITHASEFMIDETNNPNNNFK